MPDGSTLASLITAGGTVGGVAVTLWGTVRRESVQAERDRRRHALEARQAAYGELLGPATQLRVQLELAGQRSWRDLDVKLAAIDEHVRTVGQRAAQVAVLAPGETAEAARALAAAATALAAFAARHAELKYDPGPEKKFLIGEIRAPFDFAAFDARLAEMYRAIDADLGDRHPAERGSSGRWARIRRTTRR
ncbi:hypothetical protein [Actinoallomurus sp. NPDC052274]|uniref:hypothetical protein n=1 Tax=Actinoallomurus sp. NPDC052274 TaxID=3155420 RepID=UPI0034256C62